MLVSWFLAPILHRVWHRHPPARPEKQQKSRQLIDLFMQIYSTSFSTFLTEENLQQLSEILRRFEALLIDLQGHSRISYICHQMHHIPHSIRNLGTRFLYSYLFVVDDIGR